MSCRHPIGDVQAQKRRARHQLDQALDALAVDVDPGDLAEAEQPLMEEVPPCETMLGVGPIGAPEVGDPLMAGYQILQERYAVVDQGQPQAAAGLQIRLQERLRRGGTAGRAQDGWVAALGIIRCTRPLLLDCWLTRCSEIAWSR